MVERSLLIGDRLTISCNHKIAESVVIWHKVLYNDSMNTTKAIRLSINEEVSGALEIARKKYPALSDAELLKVGLSLLVIEDKNNDNEKQEIQNFASHSVGHDYLSNSKEDLYDNE